MGIVDGFIGSREYGQAGLFGQFACPEFIAHLFHDFGFWADETDTRLFTSRGESGVFRKKTVSGMDGVGANQFSGLQYPFQVQIALLWRRLSNEDGLVRQLDVEGVFVGGGVDGNGGYA